ncbi:MAG: type II toxin-antitoxin system prevent-host-death family antitoxin [Alphaproteobacteria bacterium]|nr:type II toxin-antitoxin system prevent-host-death family antitoxin [Alphaproteobacteria bacterium]
MDKVTVAEAKAGLSALLDRVEAGGEVLITRRGAPIARLVGTEPRRKKLDLKRLAAFRATLRPDPTDSATRLRKMRDAGY